MEKSLEAAPLFTLRVVHCVCEGVTASKVHLDYLELKETFISVCSRNVYVIQVPLDLSAALEEGLPAGACVFESPRATMFV